MKIVFEGPRQCGKTTVMQAIVNLLIPTARVVDPLGSGGKIGEHALQVDLSEDDLSFIRRRIDMHYGDTDIHVEMIRQWAHDRNLIDTPTCHPQMTKLTEEVGEVAAAIARDDKGALKDGIGDVAVVLIILAAQNGLTFEECVGAAYNEIKDRTGRMVDGIFVRDKAE